jgi:MMP 1-O-methyltransferase
MSAAARLDAEQIVERMRPVEGWFAEDEARLLIDCAVRVLSRRPGLPMVEVGSYLGRSTVVLASVAQAYGTLVYAIDPHQGDMGPGVGAGYGSTFERFRANLEAAGVADAVVPIVARCQDVPWNVEIGLVFIDGWHEYASVRGDFEHFAPHLAAGGFAVFHDYLPAPDGREHYDVIRAVDDILADGWRKVGQASSLIALARP